MMAKMILLQPEPRAPLHRKMMRRVMKHVVTDIAENQPGKDGRRQLPENQKEDTVKKKGQWNADAGRHHEHARVAWVIVMNAVDDVVQSLPHSSIRFVVKGIPVT